MSKPTQIYIDDSGMVHVSYPCDTCSEWVHTEDHCGDTKPDGTDEYMCGDCYADRAVQNEDKEHAMALDPHAVRGDAGWVDPTIPELSEELCATFLRESGFKVEKVEGFDLDDEVCRKMEARETLDEMYIHDWLIMYVDFDWKPNVQVAIHKDVVSDSLALHVPDCSSPDPDDDISRFGPGTCAMSLQAIDDLHADVNAVYCLVDSGVIDGKKAHLIFKQGGAA